jgi:hypothetical protein
MVSMLDPSLAAERYLDDVARIDELAELAFESFDEVARACRSAADALPRLTLSNLRGRRDAEEQRRRAEAFASLKASIARLQELRWRWLALAPEGIHPVEFLNKLFLVINARRPRRQRRTVRVAGETFPTGHRASFAFVADMCRRWSFPDESICPTEAFAACHRRIQHGGLTVAQTAIENEQVALLTFIGAIGRARGTGAETAGQDPDGDWLVPPVSKAELARRVGVSVKKLPTLLGPHRLRQWRGERQSWTVDKAGMGAALRAMVECRPVPPSAPAAPARQEKSLQLAPTRHN